MISSRHIVNALGYAGLVPLVFAALLSLLDPQHALLSRAIIEAYSFGIVSFLCGSWWGMSIGSKSRKMLLLSNFYFLIAVIIFVFLSHWWLIAAAFLLYGTLVTEQRAGRFFGLPGFYRRMRLVLTALASMSVLTLHFAT